MFSVEPRRRALATARLYARHLAIRRLADTRDYEHIAVLDDDLKSPDGTVCRQAKRIPAGEVEARSRAMALDLCPDQRALAKPRVLVAAAVLNGVEVTARSPGDADFQVTVKPQTCEGIEREDSSLADSRSCHP
jgi:hypothetical protein